MARSWFGPQNTADLDRQDLAILNRATRHLVDYHHMNPTHRWLSTIRQTYQRGMSARALISVMYEQNHDLDG